MQVPRWRISFALRESRMLNAGTQLKPQAVYVVLEIVAAGSRRAPYSVLAMELGMSPSEVYACVIVNPKPEG